MSKDDRLFPRVRRDVSGERPVRYRVLSQAENLQSSETGKFAGTDIRFRIPLNLLEGPISKRGTRDGLHHE